MGGVSDFLFGSSGSSKQVGTADLLTSSQKNLLNKLASYASNSVGSGLDAYGGDLTAEASPLQSLSFNAIGDMLSGGGILGQGQQALTGLLSDFDPTEATETWQKTVGDPMMETWENQVLPKIKEQYLALGAGSSGAANRAIASSGEDLAESMSSNLAKYLYDEGEAHRDRQAKAADQALSYATTPVTLGLSAGSAQRGIDQDSLTANYQEWLRTQAENNPTLSLATDLLGVKAVEPLLSSGTGNTGALLNLAKTLGAIF